MQSVLHHLQGLVRGNDLDHERAAWAAGQSLACHELCVGDSEFIPARTRVRVLLPVPDPCVRPPVRPSAHATCVRRHCVCVWLHSEHKIARNTARDKALQGAPLPLHRTLDPQDRPLHTRPLCLARYPPRVVAQLRHQRPLHQLQLLPCSHHQTRNPRARRGEAWNARDASVLAAGAALAGASCVAPLPAFVSLPSPSFPPHPHCRKTAAGSSAGRSALSDTSECMQAGNQPLAAVTIPSPSSSPGLPPPRSCIAPRHCVLGHRCAARVTRPGPPTATRAQGALAPAGTRHAAHASAAALRHHLAAAPSCILLSVRAPPKRPSRGGGLAQTPRQQIPTSRLVLLLLFFFPIRAAHENLHRRWRCVTRGAGGVDARVQLCQSQRRFGPGLLAGAHAEGHTVGRRRPGVGARLQCRPSMETR
jgi:hypothetical protein